MRSYWILSLVLCFATTATYAADITNRDAIERLRAEKNRRDEERKRTQHQAQQDRIDQIAERISAALENAPKTAKISEAELLKFIDAAPEVSEKESFEFMDSIAQRIFHVSSSGNPIRESSHPEALSDIAPQQQIMDLISLANIIAVKAKPNPVLGTDGTVEITEDAAIMHLHAHEKLVKQALISTAASTLAIAATVAYYLPHQFMADAIGGSTFVAVVLNVFYFKFKTQYDRGAIPSKIKVEQAARRLRVLDHFLTQIEAAFNMRLPTKIRENILAGKTELASSLFCETFMAGRVRIAEDLPDDFVEGFESEQTETHARKLRSKL